MFSCLSTAFPAKAGIQMIDSHMSVTVWVPACAGNAGVGGFKPLLLASLRGAKRRSNPGGHQFESVSVHWVASLRSQ